MGKSNLSHLGPFLPEDALVVLIGSVLPPKYLTGIFESVNIKWVLYLQQGTPDNLLTCASGYVKDMQNILTFVVDHYKKGQLFQHLCYVSGHLDCLQSSVNKPITVLAANTLAPPPPPFLPLHSQVITQ